MYIYCDVPVKNVVAARGQVPVNFAFENVLTFQKSGPYIGTEKRPQF